MRSTITNIVINHKIDSNSLTISPIREEINYYKWWNMAMEMEKGLEIWRQLSGKVWLWGVVSLCFLIP